MKRLLHMAGVVVSLAAIIAVAAYIARVAGSMDISRFMNGRALLGVTVAAIASAAIIPISALAWRQLLAACGEFRTWSSLATIMGVTQLAKYLPGNVGQHVGRLGLSAREGIPVGLVVVTIIVESVLAVLAAASVGVLGCLVAGASIADHWFPNVAHGWLVTAGIFLTVATGTAVVFAPKLVAAAIRRLSAGRMSPRVPDGKVLLQAFMLYIGNYIVLGAGITVLAGLVADVPWQDSVLLTGTFAMAWILGFFMPGAPAGLGVREGVMLTLLHVAGLSGDGVAVVLGIRVATTLSDVLCFVVATLARLASRRHATPRSKREVR